MTKLADAFVAVTADFGDLLSSVRDTAQQAGDVLDQALTSAGTTGGQGAAAAAQGALAGIEVPTDEIAGALADAGTSGGQQAGAAAAAGIAEHLDGVGADLGEQLGRAGTDAAGEIGAALAGAGATAGPQIADDVTNAMSGVGGDVGDQLAGGIEAGAQSGGEAAATGLGATFGAAGEKAGELFGEQFGAIAGTLIAAIGVKDLLQGGLGELEASQAAAAQTTVRLQDMGEAAGVSAEHVHALAEELSGVTGISPAAVQSAENFLLTLGNIRDQVGVGNDIFDRAIKDSQDLAVALGVDLGTAAQRLGRMLNDPVQGMNALTRAGLTFTQAQKDQIKAMVAVGDTLGAQKLILDEVEQRYRGSADAFGNTLPGQIAKAKLAFDELGASILQLVLPVLEPLASLVSDVASALSSLLGFLGDHLDVVAAFGAAISVAFAPAILGAVVDLVAAVGTQLVVAFRAAQAAAVAAWEAMAANPELLAVVAVIAGISLAVNALSVDFGELATAALKSADALAPKVDTSHIETLSLALSQYGQEIDASQVHLSELLRTGHGDLQAGIDLVRTKSNIDDLIAKQHHLADASNAVAAAWHVTPDAAYGLIKSLSDVDKPTQQILDDLRNQPEAAAKFIAGLKEAGAAGDSFATRADTWSKAIGDFQTAQAGYAKAIGDALAGTRSQLGIFDAIKDKAQVTAQAILASIQTMALAAVQESANIQKLVQAGAPTALLQQLVQQGPEYVAAVANTSNAVRKQIFDSFGAYLTDTANLTKTKIGAGIEDGVNAAKAKVDASRAALGAAFNALFAGPISAVKNFVGNFVTSLAPLPGAGGKAASDTVSVIQSQLQRMPGTAEQLGLETGTSLSRGLAQGTAAVGQVVADLNAQLNGITHTIPVDIVIRRIDAGSATGTGGKTPMAFGGPVLGGSGVRDDVPILGMGGEWMLTQSDVSMLGGFAGVRGMLNDLRAGHGAFSALHAPAAAAAEPAAGLGPVVQALREQTRRLEDALVHNAQLTSSGVGGVIDGAAGSAHARYKNRSPRGGY